MIAHRVGRAILLLTALVTAPELLAQGGAIAGRVISSEGGQPVATAQVQAVTSGGQIAGSVRSREDGTYRLVNLNPGTYSVVVTRLGFALNRRQNVNVTAGGTATVDVTLTSVVTELNPVVVTSGRQPEKAISAPASIAVIDVREIEERTAVTAADHLKGLAGVDIQTGGLAQSNVVARGFNNAFSGSILTLQDYRFAAVPSLRVNVPFMFTATNEDIERIEVLLGPASALYGPNSANGVLHIITKSPFDSPGTTFTLDGGERSLLRGSLRHAGVMTPKVAYKVSGEYFTANDFATPSARDTLGSRLPNFDPGEPDVFPAGSPRAGQANVRDFDLQRVTAEARLDIRPVDDAELVSTVGYTKIGSGLEYTGANGTAQIKNWTYLSFQQRARFGRLFAQVFYNTTNAGNDDATSTDGTFLLRSGQPIVDKSNVFSAQIQHGLTLGSKQDFIYGVDYIATNPETGGTINGRNEDIDNVREIGGYIQSTTQLSRMFDVILAARLDNNDQIDGNQFSPRAALVFKPDSAHNFRFTYNRAFSTPANFSYFLDLIQARNIGGTPYNIRALGNPPKTGWEFNRTCGQTNAGLCMKSIFSGGNNWIPSSAAAVYPGVVNALRNNLIAMLTPSLGAQAATGLVNYLGTLRPTDAQVGSRIAYLNTATTNVDPASLRDIGPLDASYNKTYEFGYKGILAQRLRLAVDAWFQTRGDVGNPAGLATPNVFFNGQQLGAYLGPQIAQALIQAGLPPAQAQAAAAQIAPQIATAAGQLPVGIVQFNSDQFANGNDVYATYTSTTDKEFKVRGVDLAVDFILNNSWLLGGSYSWVSDKIFDEIVSSNNTALMLNAPASKGAVSAKYRNDPRRYSVELRTRFNDAYPVNSGVYAAADNLAGRPITFQRPGSTTFYRYDAVESATVLDIGASYRLPVAGTRQVLFSINGTNIFDKRYRTMPGAPLIGRLVVTRLQYSF